MEHRRIASLGLTAALAVAAACSVPAEAEPRRAAPFHAAARTEASAAPEEPEQSGDEVELPPAPEASTLADGRALALPGATGFLSTWRVLGEDEEPDHEATLVAFASRKMELSEAARPGADAVRLGATLLVTRETHAWLLVGMRGAAAVSLDGEELGRGESEDRFRSDRLLVRLPLAAGEHRLAIRFEKPDRGAWRGAVRWLSAQTRPGPGNVAIALGRPDEATAAERAAEAVAFEEIHTLGEVGPVVRVRAHLPAGALAVPIAVSIGEDGATLAPGPRLHADALTHEAPMPERGNLDIAARAGDREARFGRRIFTDRRALDAAATLRDLLPDAPEGARAPVAWRMQELLRVVREGDGDAQWRRTLEGEARRIARELGRERDPFGRVRGYERMAFFSRLDGTAQEYELFVPPAYRDTRAWPLLITLHGYKGNAGDYFRNTFGLARNYEEGESLLAHGRHGTPPTRGSMIVIGPTGRGQSFYRHAGEVDILEAIEDVRRRFRVDEDRIYITGGSMGGTGAAYVPYRRPDLFAASAALAGYHDQRVRSDTDHEALSDAERFLEAHRSDVDWAENGLHLPMLLVRGTRDRPLQWTRSLVQRLGELGYRHEHREPELGHNVWTETYADGAIFRYLGRYRRPSHPRHVRLRTARERTLEAWWVRIEQREAPDRFAEVDATIEDGTITARVEGARAVTFAPEPPLVEEGAPIAVRVGEREITGPAPLTIEAHEGGWRAATQAWPEPGARAAGVSGPIRDVFHEPLTFVVGTQDPDHTLINRLVAERWAHPKGWIVDYPIVDDVDVTDAMIRERTLVLIGPPASNAVHARMADELPIRVDADGVHVGDATHRGEHVGAAFVARSPLAPERSVLVLAGPRPIGTFHATELPDILPDYVVWDETVSHARDRWACGGTGCAYLAHGFLDMHMRLPSR